MYAPMLETHVTPRRTAADQQDDARFSSFTRDLARRHRRPRSYPPPPSVMADALEQLCGGSHAVVPTAYPSLPTLEDPLSLYDLADLDVGDSSPS